MSVPELRSPTPADAAIRPGETCVSPPPPTDAGLLFIGRIRTPWAEPSACPKRGDPVAGPDCRIEIVDLWRPALDGLAAETHVQVLYWLHLARRDLVSQRPRAAMGAFGTFALRSPMRPNPIAVSLASLIAVEADGLIVRGLDCVDGTPLLDLKPEACPVLR